MFSYDGATLLADTVRRFETMPASHHASRKACLDYVREADVVVLALGSRYGAPEPDSGLSPTHEEYREAKRLNKPVLAFVQTGITREPLQEAFVEEVQGQWSDGHFAPRFASPDKTWFTLMRDWRAWKSVMKPL